MTQYNDKAGKNNQRPSDASRDKARPHGQDERHPSDFSRDKGQDKSGRSDRSNPSQGAGRDSSDEHGRNKAPR